MLVMEIHHFFPKHTKHKKRVFRVAYSLGGSKSWDVSIWCEIILIDQLQCWYSEILKVVNLRWRHQFSVMWGVPEEVHTLILDDTHCTITFKKSCLTYSYHRSKKLNFSSDKLFSFFSFYWWFRRMRNKKEIGLLEVFSERIEMQKVLSVLTLCMQVTWTFVIPNAT